MFRYLSAWDNVMSGYCEQCGNQQCICVEIEDFIYKTLSYLNIFTDDESAAKKIIIEQGNNLIKKYGGEMSLEPEKIYLHDPHGVFDEAGHGGKETIVWSEDRIDENDYEYTRSPKNLPKADVYSLLSDVRALKARNEKLTDIINWMSNGYGIDHMEIEYDIEMAEIESEHFS